MKNEKNCFDHGCSIGTYGLQLRTINAAKAEAIQKNIDNMKS